MKNKRIYLKNYTPPTMQIDSIFLDIELYDDHAMVVNRMVYRKAAATPILLQGDDLELISLRLNGETVDAQDISIQEQDLSIRTALETCTLEITTKIYPQKNTQLSGLYGSGSLFCTQCEAQGFRRITYFPDRPDVLTLYTTKITADKSKYPILLSNGNRVDSGSLDNNRHWVLWEDPFKKPSYLFAMVAGNLSLYPGEFVTCSGKHVQLEIYVEPHNIEKCAHAMESLKKAMRWDEERFGREYDLKQYMIVAVRDFNMGAMENKGLNIFNDKYVLGRPEMATDEDYLQITSVIGHEYFHNWTGNRITCRDWFQLSLKEGLTVFREQEFCRDIYSRDARRISDVQLLQNAQFPEDAGMMAHPVRPLSYEEINNFYTATVYEKGAEVIRMQETILGQQGFRAGMDLYFKRHDGQAVTIDDFVACMEDANHVDLSAFKNWYNIAGTPNIHVTHTNDQHGCTIHIRQTCHNMKDGDIKTPLYIPIRMQCFTDHGPYKEEQVIILKDIAMDVTIPSREKLIPSLLRDFSAPVIMHDDLSNKEILTLLRMETNGYAKWRAASRLAISSIEKGALTEELITTYAYILQDSNLDPALCAYILSPPTFEDTIIGKTDINPEHIERSRLSFQHNLGKALYPHLETMYAQLLAEETGSLEDNATAKRKLRNVCLTLMMKGNEQATIIRAQKQYVHAETMTDRMAAFTLLAHASEINIRNEAISSFYTQWHKEPLVLDKWFSVQAINEHDAFNTVKKLVKHPDFTIKNPNRVRSVIGAFSQFNPLYFHASDGSGYRLLMEYIEILDKTNPQVAARLATPFTRWQRLDKKRQKEMLKCLEHLNTLTLSRDTRELVVKSLCTEPPR